MGTHVINSAETGEWYTPPELVDLARRCLGGTIDLDPCGTPVSNGIVGARWFSHDFESDWLHLGHRVFFNPPGTCRKDESGKFSVCGNTGRCSCGLTMRALDKTISEAEKGAEVFFLAYNMGGILRRLGERLHDYLVVCSIAIPSKRIAFLDPTTLKPKRGTNVDSAFLFITPTHAGHRRFREECERVGCSVWRQD